MSRIISPDLNISEDTREEATASNAEIAVANQLYKDLLDKARESSRELGEDLKSDMPFDVVMTGVSRFLAHFLHDISKEDRAHAALDEFVRSVHEDIDYVDQSKKARDDE